MPKFPEPPPVETLRSLGPRPYTLLPGTGIWRICMRGGLHPVAWNEFRHWGPVKAGRFDHHLPPPRLQTRGILYAATRIATCVAEVFQGGRTIDVMVNQPWLAGFTVEAPLQLLDLTGTWPTAAGASMAINSGLRARAQRWARAIYSAYPDVAGLWYASSMYANHPAVALFERAQHALADEPSFYRPLSDPALLDDLVAIAHTLQYKFILPQRQPG